MLLPQMGTSVVEGTVIGWSKAIGDTVAVDETLCEISTDKVDTECPSPVAGTLAEILVQDGETVEVGTAIARIAAEAGASPAAPAAAPTPATAPARAANGAIDGYVSPVVSRMAQEHQIDLAQITGTGRRGRITKRDVVAHLAAGPGEPKEERPLHSESPYRPDPPVEAPTAPRPSPARATTEPLSRMRQSIGSAMLRSQEVAATCHTVVECDMFHVERRRRELGVTALPIVARAVVETLREFPELNATLEGTAITRYEGVQLGIAVSLGDDGLIVPVIRDAQDLAPEGIAQAIKEIARRARDRQLAPDDVRGASFTITNPGAAGAVFATPIINVPQVAILDLEAIVRRPTIVTGADGTESIAIRPMANLILGWDHRAIDGMYAARFLTALRTRLEDPHGRPD
ncbi:catalytic domain of components of various dehydrogenase complexes [Conexibacter woesei DSM 14684]|uniref:Dihydrolipoamide acetyltransferase component of pyruvate dehydrogenase complex n=1 Tax=Conexibacter woesei (strain DSM 14684 / CCUG 47730 / CIP 108061 / JCM 11494 / NBRC 100937 / ID131577) TaxID=469383 RepID=D3F7S1_CONWI|nr:catalytic domain of components of various dehydrogenase complexes [Conexibacter woesei DSM 14684]